MEDSFAQSHNASSQGEKSIATAQATQANKARRLLFVTWREPEHFDYDWHFTNAQLAHYSELSVTKLSAEALYRPGAFLGQLRFIKDLFKLAGQHDFIVSLENSRPSQVIAVLKTLRILRTKLMIVELGLTHRQSSLRAALYRLFLRFFYASADIALMQSKHKRDTFRREQLLGHKTQVDHALICMYDSQIAMVQQGAAQAAQHSAPEGILFSAGNSYRDYDTLAAAAHSFPDKQFYVTADGLDLPPSLHHLPWGPLPEYVAYLLAAQIIIIPLLGHDHDSGINVLYEAWLLKKPVIITMTPTIRDHLSRTQEEVCLTYEAGDTEGLRQQISYALEHPEQMQRMGEAAQRYLFEHYTSEHYLAQVVESIETYEAKT